MTKSTLLAQDSFFGTIEQPKELDVYGTSGGLILLLTNMMTLAVIVGGIIALINVIIAGFTYITSAGDSKAHEKVLQKLHVSFLGMILMIAAPAIMAVIGWVLFQDSTFFLKPVLKGPGT